MATMLRGASAALTVVTREGSILKRHKMLTSWETSMTLSTTGRDKMTIPLRSQTQMMLMKLLKPQIKIKVTHVKGRKLSLVLSE